MNTVSTHRPGGARPVRRELPRLPTLADLMEANRTVARYARAQASARTLPELPPAHTLVAGTEQKWRQAALGQRRLLLRSRDASAVAEAVNNAVFTPSNPDVTAMLVAQLFDCFPSDKLVNPQTFFEALVFDLGDASFSDATIAAACIDVRRTSKFRPSIAEVLDRCRAKHRYAQAVADGRWRYTERLRAVHLVLHHTGGDPDPDEVAEHALSHEPLLVAEYAKGSTNEWWYDDTLNLDLMLEAGETDEEWRERFRRMKDEAEADPAGHRLRIERARGAQAGRMLAWEYHQRRGLDRRRDALAQLERQSLLRFPERLPAELHGEWLSGADRAFVERFDELEPNYDAEEQARHERDAREHAEREAHLRRYRTSRLGRTP